uniref:Reverse transcriptase domain-containing protein n=1 Tax=Macrostomum lignano TaxID=282301 RepID=A0A1I8FHY4_9PLAT
GHYNSEAILRRHGKQEAACDCLAPFKPGETEAPADKAEADRQLAASLDASCFGRQRLMSAAAAGPTRPRRAPKTPEAERPCFSRARRAWQTELGDRRAAVESCLQQRSRGAARRDGGEKAEAAARPARWPKPAVHLRRAESEQRLDRLRPPCWFPVPTSWLQIGRARLSPAPTLSEAASAEGGRGSAPLWRPVLRTEPDSLPEVPPALRDAFDDFRLPALRRLQGRWRAANGKAGNERARRTKNMQNGPQDLGRLFDRLRRLLRVAGADNLAKAAEVHELQPQTPGAKLIAGGEEKLLSIPSGAGTRTLALWEKIHRSGHYESWFRARGTSGRTSRVVFGQSVRRLDPDNAKADSRARHGVELKTQFRQAGDSAAGASQTAEGAHEAAGAGPAAAGLKFLAGRRPPEMRDDLLAKLADQRRWPGRARQRSAEFRRRTGRRQLNERLADVENAGRMKEREAVRQGEEGEEFNEEIEKIVDDAIAMKAVLDDPTCRPRAPGPPPSEPLATFADKVRQAQQALASVDVWQVAPPFWRRGGAAAARSWRRFKSSVRGDPAATAPASAVATRAAAANAPGPPGVSPKRSDAPSRRAWRGLEAQAERASARIEAAALSALICRSDLFGLRDGGRGDQRLDRVAAGAGGRGLRRRQGGRRPARRRPQQLLRLQDFKDAGGCPEGSGGAARRHLQQAQRLKRRRSLLRLLADCERAENRCWSVKPRCWTPTRPREARPTEEADAFLYDAAAAAFRWNQRTQPALSNSAAAACSGGHRGSRRGGGPLPAAAARCPELVRVAAPPGPVPPGARRQGALPPLPAFAGDELDGELDRFGELLDPTTTAVSEGDSASVSDEESSGNCRVRDTEAKKLAGLLAKMRELRDEFDVAGIYPQAGAACKAPL